jgi:UDP-N-acetylmuramyl pentapeptide phosphotransferase/UDP-N-acetylglucosamine-1-phosphate transferase
MMTFREVALVAGSTATASLCVTYGCRELALRHGLLDRPNARSAHTLARPRLGGIAIVGSFLGAACLLTWRGSVLTTFSPLLAITGGIAVLGLADDLHPIPARWRLALQLAAAVAVVTLRWDVLPNAADTAFAWLAPRWVVAALTVTWIVWLTNLYNFMDGIDGLAAGQAVIAAFGIGGAAWSIGATGTAWLLVALAGASAGFLVFNFPRATIFMGDVGSTPLGFFFACVPFLGEPHRVPLQVVAIALSLFILDATTTLLRRLARGERWYEAHRTHTYQRPLAAGVPHHVITSWAYVGMVIVATVAAVAPGVASSALPRLGCFAVVGAVFGLVHVAVTASERRPGRRLNGRS